MPGQLVITILGEGREMDFRYEVMSAVVENTVNRIACAEVTILDSGNPTTKLRFLEISDDDFFKPGNEFEVRLGYLEQPRSADTKIFTGILVKHRIRMSGKGAYLTLCLKAHVIGMTRVRRNVVFPRDMTDTQIVEKIIGGYDKVEPGVIDAGDYAHTGEMVQHYCLDWDFILSRAAANGRWVICAGSQISVVPPKVESKSAYILDFSIEDCYSADMEINILDQVSSVSAGAWDIAEHALLEKQQSQATQPDQGNLLPGELAQALGIPDVRLQSLVDIDTEEVEAWANARLLQCLLSLYRGTVALPGTTALKPGDTIEFAGLNERFNGKTIVSAIRHEVSVGGGWQTHVQFGLSAGWMQHARMMTEVDAAGLVPGIKGLQVGIVQNFSKDQAGKFRIPVLIPAFSPAPGTGNDTENIVLARLGKVDAGAGRGAFFHPEPGDEVILGFFNNDPRQPVILGSLHGPKNKPPDDVIDDNTGYRFKGFVIDENISLRFDKSANPAVIDIVASDGNMISLTADDQGGLMVEAKNGILLEPAETLEVTTKKTKLDTTESLEVTTKKTRFATTASLGIDTQSTDMKSQTVALTGKLDVK